jgi:hypothetical protein
MLRSQAIQRRERDSPAAGQATTDTELFVRALLDVKVATLFSVRQSK